MMVVHVDLKQHGFVFFVTVNIIAGTTVFSHRHIMLVELMPSIQVCLPDFESTESEQIVFQARFWYLYYLE